MPVIEKLSICWNDERQKITYENGLIHLNGKIKAVMNVNVYIDLFLYNEPADDYVEILEEMKCLSDEQEWHKILNHRIKCIFVNKLSGLNEE